MPGIVGFISTETNAGRRPPIDRMLNSMLHEPTYTSGQIVEESLGVWAGWVCHGGSFSDCLPIWNETKDVCLLFVGEGPLTPDRSESPARSEWS